MLIVFIHTWIDFIEWQCIAKWKAARIAKEWTVFEPGTWHYSCGLGSSGPPNRCFSLCTPLSLFFLLKPPVRIGYLPSCSSAMLGCVSRGWPPDTQHLPILANSEKMLRVLLPSLKEHGAGLGLSPRAKHLECSPWGWGPVNLPLQRGVKVSNSDNHIW